MNPIQTSIDQYTSQEEVILEHLRRYKSITNLEALRLYGVWRLSDRIFRLRRKMHNITTVMITEGNKEFAKYILNQ